MRTGGGEKMCVCKRQERGGSDGGRGERRNNWGFFLFKIFASLERDDLILMDLRVHGTEKLI